MSETDWYPRKSMSAEERQAGNWTTAFRDNAVANYKSSSHILSMLKGLSA